jgi:hypothetical protein
MKLSTITALVASALMLTACADPKVINGTTYQPYGIANEEAHKNPNIVYQVDKTSVILAVIFCETLIIPVYVVGWSLYEPVGPKDPTAVPH